MSRSGYIVLTAEFQKVGRRWTVHCEELGTATFGRSLPEAEKRIKEAVLLHLNALEEVGERDRFFREHNIPLHPEQPKGITVNLPVKPQSDVFFQPLVHAVPEPTPA